MVAGIRLLLIWLIALALPVQGIAAATMRFCAPVQSMPAVVHAAADHAKHHGHDHGAADSAHAAKAHAPDHDDAAGDQKCSACACSMATALPPAPTSLPVVGAAVEFTALVPPTYVGPDSASLERPPKLARA